MMLFYVLGVSNWPQTNFASRAQTRNQANFPPPKSRQSIIDKDDFLNDDDDEILLIASQQAEEHERTMNQKRQQMSEEISYHTFKSKPQSTQLNVHCSQIQTTKDLKTVVTEKTVYVDLTQNSQACFAQPSQTESNRNVASTGSSQKENISAQQMLTKQANKIKALEIQLNNLRTVKADLEEKVLMKEGETSNLRRDKNVLEDQVRSLKLQKLKEVDAVKDDPEKTRLRKENEKLRAEKNIQTMNSSFCHENGKKSEEKWPISRTLYFFNVPLKVQSQVSLNAKKLLDVAEDIFPISDVTSSAVRDFEASTNVVKVQLFFSKLHSHLESGGSIEDINLWRLFKSSAMMILRISNYIEYLEAEKEHEITFDTDPAYTACTLVSIPFYRQKLTNFNFLLNTLNKNEGFLSINQAEKMFPDEVCSKPRRIIACYATIARCSKKFSEMLLLENVMSNVAEGFRTVVSVLIDTLELGVAESNNIYDFSGFVMSCAALLNSLGHHYSSYKQNNAIDDILERFLRALLDCRCDNPFMLLQVSEFLVQVTRQPKKNQLALRLCSNYPSSRIDVSKLHKCCCYPHDACIFQLFTMYLMTTFKINAQLNRLEISLLLEICLNLNRITSQIQDMSSNTFRFLNREEMMTSSQCCSCFSSLTNTIITLNHTAQENRRAMNKSK